MQAHLSGKSHKKKTKQINRFACDLCLIEVSSQETLQTHYQGNNSRSDVLSKTDVRWGGGYIDSFTKLIIIIYI